MNSAVGTINTYARIIPLTDVQGRVRYACEPENQKIKRFKTDREIVFEKLDCVVGERDNKFWKELAADCRYHTKNAKKKTTKKGEEIDGAVEGREIMLCLPNELGRLSLKERIALLEKLKVLIDEETGTDCLIACHNSHPEPDIVDNWHVHIIIPERARLKSPVILTAERDLYYDCKGKRVYHKTDVYENGKLKPGCTVIKKGTVLHTKNFGSKNNNLSLHAWLPGFKNKLANWINAELNPNLKHVVQNSNSLFISTIHVSPYWKPENALEAAKKAEILAYNKKIKEYNEMVRKGEISEFEAEMNRLSVAAAQNRRKEILKILYGQKEQITKTDRDMYRDSAIAWEKWRECPDYLIEEKESLFKEARGISIEIDLAKKKDTIEKKVDDFIERAGRGYRTYEEAIKDYEKILFALNEYISVYKKANENYEFFCDAIDACYENKKTPSEKLLNAKSNAYDIQYRVNLDEETYLELIDFRNTVRADLKRMHIDKKRNINSLINNAEHRRLHEATSEYIQQLEEQLK